MVSLPHAVEDLLGKAVGFCKFNVALDGQVHDEYHISKRSREADAANESVDPLVNEAVEVFEIVDGSEQEVDVA